jgi:metalloendopeptidase OMA1, mitochondrial
MMTSSTWIVDAYSRLMKTMRRVYRLAVSGPSICTSWLSWIGLSAALMVASCQNLNTYSVNDDIQLGTQAYGEVTKNQPILTSGPEYERVQRVTKRLTASVLELKPEIAPRFEWEVIVIDDINTVNAFCLPGGKMAVYTGILGPAQDDTGLAVVMGHEIAHATERHGTERLTRNGLMGSAVAILVEDEDYQEVASVIANLGVGMPWGRNDELEADFEGLFIMANAGYDPRDAPRFWERMSVVSGSGSGAGNTILAADSLEEFLSTHPSNQRRIDQLTAAIPAAMPLYEAAQSRNQER